MRTKTLSKKAAALIIAVAASLTLMITGCDTSAGEDVTKRMDDLEMRVQTLEDKIEMKADKGAGIVKDSVADASYSSTEDYATYDGYLKDIEKRASDAIAQAESMDVPSDNAQKQSVFQDALKPLEDIEDELSRLEDAYELAGAGGSVSADELTKLDVTSDAIDDTINKAIDDLERRFGIDK